MDHTRQEEVGPGQGRKWAGPAAHNAVDGWGKVPRGHATDGPHPRWGTSELGGAVQVWESKGPVLRAVRVPPWQASLRWEGTSLMALATPSWSRFSRISQNRMVLLLPAVLEFPLMLTVETGGSQLWAALTWGPGGTLAHHAPPREKWRQIFSPCHRLVPGWALTAKQTHFLVYRLLFFTVYISQSWIRPRYLTCFTAN